MKISVKETVLFAFIGALMYISKVLLSFIPNVHLIATFIVATTVVFRAKALYPLYTFVFLCGLFGGFNLWWIPYLYIWTLLWGVIMLIPQKLKYKERIFIYVTISSLHGFLFGTLYAPFQAIAFGLSLKGTIAWIVAGLPFDAIHGFGNLVCGLLIMPMIKVFTMAKEKIDFNRLK